MNNKGQAAMEFLMTYGWAILVVLIAIGALAYFGVLNPGRFLPNSCTLSPGFACGDFKVDDGGIGGSAPANTNVLIQVRNGLGKTVYMSAVAAFTLDPPPTGQNVANTDDCVPNANNPVIFNDGQVADFYWTCTTAGSGAIIPAGSAGSRFKGSLNMIYSETSGGLTHTVTGDITTRIE